MSLPSPRRADDFSEEVAGTYRAAARLRMYTAWATGVSVLLAVGVAGAMIIGWMDASDGFTWLGFALLTGVVSAARFYADATRTTVNAAMLERQLDTDEDLHAGTAEYRQRLRKTMVGGVAVLALATGAIAMYSIANADTRTTQSDDDNDDDDDDDETESDRDDAPTTPASSPEPAAGSDDNDNDNDD